MSSSDERGHHESEHDPQVEPAAEGVMSSPDASSDTPLSRELAASDHPRSLPLKNGRVAEHASDPAVPRIVYVRAPEVSTFVHTLPVGPSSPSLFAERQQQPNGSREIDARAANGSPADRPKTPSISAAASAPASPTDRTAPVAGPPIQNRPDEAASSPGVASVEAPPEVTIPALPAEPFAAGTSTRRLWRSLAHRPKQEPEIKDLDRVGDLIIGTMHRRLHPRRILRQRAEEVVALSDRMGTLSERAFDTEIETARDAARCARRSRESRQHQFAVVREAVRRTIGISLFTEQVMGGWVMEDGCIAEMLTGEGKTVTACLTAAVRGWMGYGVHVVTVNDYLARRDAELNGAIYKRLGLSVGIIQHESESDDRRSAYACDITYTTDQQLIFDHLRDKLRSPLRPRVSALLLDELTETSMGRRPQLWTEQVVHRGLHCALIDEADSVLIDQATTPAIIGMEGGEDAAADYYRVASDLAGRLVANEHYKVDLNQHRVDLTRSGRDELDALADKLPSFWSGPRRREELVVQALQAKELFHKDDHYILRDDDVHIVDPQTGRVLEGRQWQLGLHQSIQAKEGLTITAARQTMARVSYQRFFQQYRVLSGMTGTAWEVRNELWRNYRLTVVRIPTHKPMIRRQNPDRLFNDRSAKFNAVADRVAGLVRQQRPVLLGTRSVEASEAMSRLLTDRGIEHRVLNAAQHDQEAAIIASAGKPGAVTVATNMAGRGTDIALGPGVAKQGGLVVIATERHESRRIDRQLFGRAGRQGDPGLAEIYVALDDQLILTSGLPVLARLARTSGLLRRMGIGRLLWWQAQRTASRRQASMRELAARGDAWLDRALYYENR